MNVQLPHTSYHVHIGSICSVVHMKQTESCYLESFSGGLHIIMLVNTAVTKQISPKLSVASQLASA